MNLYFIDGIIVTCIGIYNTIKYKNVQTVVNTINSVFLLNALERIIFYSVCQNLFFEELAWVFVIPNVQNTLIKSIHADYEREKSKLIKFIISKKIIQYFQTLFHISNYQIFKVYSLLTHDFYIKALQNTLFIFVVYLLKQSEKTYMYYRIIKYHAFISSYYNFTISNAQQANEILHDLILENRWESLNDIETIHAFFILFHKGLSNYFSFSKDDIYTKIQFLYFRLWIPYYIYFLCTFFHLYVSIFVLFVLQLYTGHKIYKYVVALFIPNSVLSLSVIYFYDVFVSITKDIIFYISYKKEIDEVILLQNNK